MGLHNRYVEMLGTTGRILTLDKDAEDVVKTKLTEAFRGMMSALFKQQGATLDINILTTDEAQAFIETHASVLDASFQKVEMSDAMRQRLTRSDYIFSGMKTFHELNEAFPSLLDENGNRKPFERFLKDVQSIDNTYNRNYLRAEYNFVQASAQMAAKWESFMQDGDRYNLQYRTAGDDKVRPEHAALNGVTLPVTDPFWEEYYPPNGWNCFIEGTPVLTKSGWRNIESIHKGELVVGGSGKFREVIGTHAKRVNDELVCILTKGAMTTCTPNHRFCTPQGWVSAEKLKTGDIIIQTGKVSAFHLLVNAIANACTLLRYGLMAGKRKRKTITALAIDNEVEGRNEKINHIPAKKLSFLEGKAGCQQVGTYGFFGFTQWGTKGTHTLRMKAESGKGTIQRLRLYIRAKKGGTDFKLFRYASNQSTVLLCLSLAHVKTVYGKFMVGLRKALTCLCPSFRIAKPLRSHCGTAMPDGDAQTVKNTAHGSAVHTPMEGKPSVAVHLREIPVFRGVQDIHAFNGFHSCFDFLRKTFFHNRYVLVEDKVTKKKGETMVYNLSIHQDESYVVPVGITHNCRCTVIQVRKSKYPVTPHDEAMALGEEATGKDTKGIFRFNAGLEQKSVPDYNPYTIRRCRDCDIAKGKLKLAFIPDNELCAACRLIRAQKHENIGAAKRILKYDERTWERTYISPKDIGLVATQLERIAEATASKAERNKFDKEMRMCKVLADNGHDVEYLQGVNRPTGQTYDILFDSIKADLKCVTGGTGNIVKYAKKALTKQGGEAVVFEIPTHDAKYYAALTEARRKCTGRIFFYIADEMVLKELKI